MAATLKFVNKLRGARVLVVGGTSGIGFSVAQAAVEYGARVVISGSNPEKLQKAVANLQASFKLVSSDSAEDDDSANLSPTGDVCDLADAKSMESNLESLLSFATQQGKHPLDHIVFTSGDSFEARKLPDVDPDHITRSYLIRGVAPVILAKLMFPKYVHKKASGSFTLTGGVNGEKPEPNWTVPAGFSYAVEGYTHGLAVDLRPLRVNCVAPGVVHTELIDRNPIDTKENILAQFRSRTLTDTVGRPEDLAEAYLYCMRDEFVTGSTIKSNGGRLLA